MRKILGVAAVFLGVVGTLVSIAAIVLGWWTAVRTDDRLTQAIVRIDEGMSQADAGLAHTEERLAAIRADLDEVRAEEQKLVAENPELPRVKAAIERLLDRLLSTIDRGATLATSLRTMAAGLRAAADLRDLVVVPVETDRARNAADGIDRAANVLNIPRARLDALKSTAAVRLIRELVDLAREAIAGSEWLAGALVNVRREITEAREWIGQWRDRAIFWIYSAASANTLVWLWAGLGQLCLIGWGRRRFASQVQPNS